MNKIFWDMGMVSMLTNTIDAVPHKHWMHQLFFVPDGEMKLTVEGIPLTGRCILVNQHNIHTFQTQGKIHFSILIMPGTQLSKHLEHSYLKGNAYCDFSNQVTINIVKNYDHLIKNPTLSSYLEWIGEWYRIWGFEDCKKSHKEEERVQSVIEFLGKHRDCSISDLADYTALSASRLAHLFKESTGVPLKSYMLLQNMFTAFELLFTGKNVTDACMDAGFDTPSHFAATVKAMMGTSTTLAVKDSEFLKVPFC